MASSDSQIAQFDQNGETFEGLAKTNGSRYWWARDLARALGYDDWTAFKKVINKAVAACALLNIQILEMFIPAEREIGGRMVEDYKLSRSACCMTALNGDSKKQNVAAAQLYFVELLEVMLDYALDGAETMDRLTIREEISAREITLNKAAQAAGVHSFGLFTSAGYRGMYDMEYQDLRRLRGQYGTKRSLLDFMGKDELAGNLFRLALTEGRLRKERTRSQEAAEHVAEQVGRTVRKTMIEQTGVSPEQLPVAQDIREVRKALRQGARGLPDLDNLDEQRVIEAQALDTMMPVRCDDAVPGCPECAGGHPASHNGSPNCTSGSIASGGTHAHCTCNYCF